MQPERSNTGRNTILFLAAIFSLMFAASAMDWPL